MSVVTFENVGQGRDVAKLGSIEIGYVMAIDWGSRGRVLYSWRVNFGINAQVELKHASSIAHAKRALVYRMAELFECGGPELEKLANATRAQADAMDRS
jgi:hypothetical protein